jgi:hypothetical protein
MGMKRIYTCNICKLEKEAGELNGFWFETNEDEPSLCTPEATDNIHICNKCQNELSRALKRKAIEYTG